MEPRNQIVQIKIEDIVPNRFQPRQNFNEEDLKELSQSIKQYGVIQPLILRQIGNKYEIIAGERRYKASIMAGLNAVPAIINNTDDKISAELAVVENLHRQELSAIEEAKSYKRLLEMDQMTQEQLAEKMGKKRSTIANKMRLLNLSEEVQNALLTNKISERHARSLLQVTDKNKQIELLNKIINERLTVKSTDDLIKKYKEEHEENSLPDLPSYKTDQINDVKEIKNKDIINIDDLNEILAIPKPEPKTRNGENEMNNNQFTMNQSSNPNNSIETNANPTPVQQPLFGNSFFPSLEDQQTNMNLNNNLWNSTNNLQVASTPEVPTTNPLPEQNPWFTPMNNAPAQSMEPVTQSVVGQPTLQPEQNSWFTPMNNTPAQPMESVTQPAVDQPTLQPEQNSWFTPMNNTPAQPMEPVTQPAVDQPTLQPEQNPWFTPMNNTSAQPMEPVTQPVVNQPTLQPEQNPWFAPMNNNPAQSMEPIIQPVVNQPTLQPEQNPWFTPMNNTPAQSMEPVTQPVVDQPTLQPEQNPWFAINNQPNAASSMGNDVIDFNPNIPQNQNLNYQGYDKNALANVINQVRVAIANVESMGYKIKTNELDLEQEYQIVIKIQKQN